MTWKPGQSGNPGGRPSEKVFTDLLRLVGNEIDPVSGKRKMRRLAEKVYELALQGEAWACNMIADRLEGRPAVETTLNVSRYQDVREYSDQELLAMIAAQKLIDVTPGTDDKSQ
jgi:hypothetical protein